MRIIVIGGVAGGATAAARMRRLDEQAEIILLEKGKYISYANCGLPYYIGDVITDREKLFLQTPEAFAVRYRIDVRVNNEVVYIDRAKKTVSIRMNSEDVYVERYDKLVISTGAVPVVLDMPGIKLDGVFMLRNIHDTDKIKNYIENHQIHNAIIVGGGFIGLEMAENLHETGAQVSIVELSNQVLTPMDFSMASLVHQHLMGKGINLYLEQEVTSFERSLRSLKVNMRSGISLPADLVILSVGVKPETTLARTAGIELGTTGGIKVNELLQTSDESIYAIGDVIEYPNPLTGLPWIDPLAGPANRQGRLVADNLLGTPTPYEGSIGTAIAHVFDLTVASTGLPGKQLRKLGKPYLSATVHPYSHATYYPDATLMSIKVTFDPDSGKLYGAQIVGEEGVDKRIDEFALAIKRGSTLSELCQLEQAYAPPYSSAKDPVAIAAYVAQNIMTGKMKPVYWRELRDIHIKSEFLLDVRTPEEFEKGSLPYAVNIPLDELRARICELPQDRPIDVFCGVGMRGYIACRILTLSGFEQVRNLVGGLKLYKAATAPIIIRERV